MSELQNLRDKIYRKQGAKFTREEFYPVKITGDLNDNKKIHIISCNVSKLLKYHEIMRVEGTKNYFVATDLLRVRETIMKQRKAAESLPGWRDVTPYYFKQPAKNEIYSIM